MDDKPLNALKRKKDSSMVRAIELVKKQIELNQRDALARSRYAECLAKRGRLREARTEIRVARDIDKSDVDIMKRAAIVSLLSGNDEEAAKWLSDAVQHGANRLEIESDPEFAILRQKTVFRDLMQPSTTMAAGPH